MCVCVCLECIKDMKKSVGATQSPNSTEICLFAFLVVYCSKVINYILFLKKDGERPLLVSSKRKNDLLSIVVFLKK